MKPSLQSRTITFLMAIICLTILSAYPSSAKAAKNHETTPASTTNQITKPVAHKKFDGWLYSKSDGSNTQIYFQYLNGDTGTLNEVQLTTSAFNKKDPKWGPDVTDLVLDDIDSPDKFACTGTVFYYLVDPRSNDQWDLYLGCAEGFDTGTPSIKFVDAPLTEQDNSIHIVDYDVSLYYSHLYKYANQVSSYGYAIVFTTPDHELNLLFHDEKGLLTDGSNVVINPEYIVDNGIHKYDYRWLSHIKNSTKIYSKPKFTSTSEYITFLYKDNEGDLNQIGITNILGINNIPSSQYDIQITNFDTTIDNPQFGPNGVSTIFFEYTDPTTNYVRLAALLPMDFDFILPYQMREWCLQGILHTDADYSRLNWNIEFWTQSDNGIKGTFERIQPDGLGNDIYAAQLNHDYLNTSCVQVKTPITTLYEDLITEETQLTCSNRNQNPMWLAKSYYDNDYNLSSSTMGRSDVVMLSDKTDSSGKLLVDIYNTDFAAEGCVDTCTENWDGTPIVDSDNNGIKDDCEEKPENPEQNPCGDIDTDNDGIFDLCDNCVNDPNPDQADSNNNDIGDVCEPTQPPPPIDTIEYRVRGGIADAFGCSLNLESTFSAYQTFWMFLTFILPMFWFRRKK